MNNELPIVLIKRKNIQTIFDYCLDNKVEFTVREKPFTVEEFEVILQITEIKKAIAFGIFARESKIEVVGVNDQPQQAKPAKKQPANTTTASTTPTNTATSKTVETESKTDDDDDILDVEEEKKAENKPFSLDLSSPSLSFS